MSKEEAEKFIRWGSLAAYIGAILRLLVLVLGMMQNPDTSLYFFPLVDVVLLAGLGFGLKRKSRICGTLLSANLIVGIVLRMFATQSFGTSTGGLIITFFVVLGTYAAFRWHKLTSKNATSTKISE